MSIVERLASILRDQNRIAGETWSKISGAVPVIKQYLRELFSYFPEQVKLLKRLGLQVDDVEERMKNAIKNFQNISENISNGSKPQLQILLESLLEAEEIRTDLYKASLRVLELKKDEQIAKEYGTFDATIILKPENKVLSGKKVQANLEVRNLSATLQRIVIYVAWLSTQGIPFKSEKEEIVLAPFDSIIRAYTHRPEAPGIHTVRITLFKEKEEVTSLSKTFEVLPKLSFLT